MSSTKKITQLKKFINTFNYPDPSWDKLPTDFPNCDTKGLTPHEEGLFSGILLIWYANYGGRPALYKRFTQSMVLILAMIASGVMITHILRSDMFESAVTVNAATVSGTLRVIMSGSSDEPYLSPGKVLESTVSGLLSNESFE